MEKDKPLVQLAIAVIAITVLSFNLNPRIKLLIGLIGVVPGTVYGFKYRNQLKKHRDGIESLREERQRIEQGNRQLEQIIAERRLKLEQDQKRIEELRETAEAEVEAAKARLEALSNDRLEELAQLEKETRRDCDRMVAESQKELAQLEKTIKDQDRRSLSEVQGEIARLRRDCANRIKQARRHWRETRRLRQEEWDSAIAADGQRVLLDRKQLDLDRQTLQSEIEMERSHLFNQKAEVAEQIAASWEEFNREKDIAIADMTDQLLAENDQRLQTELDSLNRQLASKQKEYDDLFTQAERDLAAKQRELESFYRAKYDEWLVPHVMEVNRLTEEVEDWQSRYQQAEEELATSRDIILPDNPWSQHHKTMAHQLQMWMKARGVLVNYYNSAIDSTKGQFTLYFQPWLDGRKAKKSLEGVLDGMMADWGLLSRPTIGEGFDSWFITLTPMSFHQSGSVQGDTVAGLIPLSFNRMPATDPRLIEPDSLAALSRDDRDRVMDQVSAESRIEEMRNFRPSALPKPGRYEITALELKTIDWLWNWRAIATRDDPDPLPNIREINALIGTAYGVTIGSSTERRDPVTGENLRSRVHRICTMLRIASNRINSNLN